MPLGRRDTAASKTNFTAFLTSISFVWSFMICENSFFSLKSMFKHTKLMATAILGPPFGSIYKIIRIEKGNMRCFRIQLFSLAHRPSTFYARPTRINEYVWCDTARFGSERVPYVSDNIHCFAAPLPYTSHLSFLSWTASFGDFLFAFPSERLYYSTKNVNCQGFSHKNFNFVQS